MSHNKTKSIPIKRADPADKVIEGVPAAVTAKHLADHDPHAHDQAKDLRSENLNAEQELKTREAMQRDHNMFPKGVASDHGKGNASNR